jgi:colanic acid/amylovoran biosynthesis glycosyltransferase
VSPTYHFAYVFERFPTFTQTFCVREVLEIERQGIRPLLFSIRDTCSENLENHFPKDLIARVHFLPESAELKAQVESWKKENKLPQEALLTLRHWGDAPDKTRVYEAIYVGMKMAELGVKHAHSHFAGVGARACWWARQFYGISYSFTGHANDIFEVTNFEVSLEKLMNDAAVVVTVSDYTARFLNGKFPKCAWKVKRVYNGLDLAPFEAIERKTEAPERFQIMSVGRLIEKKGFDDLIKSCALLKKKGAPEFHCVIAGDGPMEDELEALIDETDTRDVMTLAGAKSQSEIKEMLGATDIFALPCVTEKLGGKDNLPTVIMEAMAVGIPNVSTRLAGVPEMVAEGETGLLTDERQPEDFADALLKMLNDADMRERFGKAGQVRARELFAKEKTAGALAKCLASHGNFAIDSGLNGFTGAFAKQLALRFLRKFQPKKMSKYARIEQEQRKARKSS